MKKIKVGLYYNYCGHQIHQLLEDHPRAEIGAIVGIKKESLSEAIQNNKDIRYYDTLEALLADESIEIVSLCSPNRRKQADDAIQCLNAGKHVYAEKPCAMTEADLDRILEAAKQNKRSFHEMAETALSPVCLKMRELIQSGQIGTVVQVFAQKSYPYHDKRPQDENLDGGLIMQSGIHAVRFVEHVTGLKITEVKAFETTLGNPHDGDLHMAASLLFKLSNGGVGSIIANYLNQKGFGHWGNEHLRIFGTKGFVEFTDAATQTRLVIGDKDYGPLNLPPKGKEFFDYMLDNIYKGEPMPFSLEDELHCTRVVIRAKESR